MEAKEVWFFFLWFPITIFNILSWNEINGKNVYAFMVGESYGKEIQVTTSLEAYTFFND